MQDAIAGFESAPLWAQIAMALFAIMALTSVVEPFVRRRKFRGKFDAIARALGQAPPSGRQLPVIFRTSADDRIFEVRHDVKTTTKNGSYRGPSGQLLITATRMSGDRWPTHQVDIRSLNTRLGRLISSKRLTGDADFDARFLVVEDGLPVRDGWLDATTRQEIARFLDAAPLPGVIWIREGELLFTMPDPWTNVDGPVVRALLQRQAALASALEGTAALRS